MIPLLIPDMPKAEDIFPYLQQIDNNRHYTNFGPLNQQLEDRIKKLLIPNSEIGVVTVSNATVGLEIVFGLLNPTKSSKILVPALTFPATATAIVRQGLTPIFSDVDPKSWQLTPEIALNAIKANPEIGLIVPVATFGKPVDVTIWDQWVEETGIPVVIDAAGAFGNQQVGKHVHIVFSLHATKTLGGGEGGFIASNDLELIQKIKNQSNFGIDFFQEGNIVTAGTNAKLSEYHAAVTLASLDRWNARKKLRSELLTYYFTQLAPLLKKGDIEFQQDIKDHTLSLLPLRFPRVKNVSTLVTFLKNHNIQTRCWYCPLLPHFKAFSKYPIVDSLPMAECLANQLLGIPFHLSLSIEQVDTIVNTLELACNT